MYLFACRPQLFKSDEVLNVVEVTLTVKHKTESQDNDHHYCSVRDCQGFTSVGLQMLFYRSLTSL